MELEFRGWHVGVAAEAIAAALFARSGYKVSVQYGANQPEYDLMIERDDFMLKVSVKGSKDGSWGLTQSDLIALGRKNGSRADYHGAIEAWLLRHGRRTIFCLVQFKEVPIDQMPRVYLATPGEIAQRLKETAGGRGDTILYEHHRWGPRAAGAGTVDSIPGSWRFSQERIAELVAITHGHQM